MIFVFLCLSIPVGVNNALSAEVVYLKISQSENPSGPASNVQPKETKAKDAFDIFFVLDSSGSMKKTDPEDFRKAAAQLMVALLGPEDRIGFISFGDSAQTLIPLTQNLSDNQKTFSEAIQKISSQALYTNIYEAIKKGYEEIKTSQRPNKILLLMSDGQMDLGSKEKDDSALKELSKLLPEVAKANIKLYTVAFSDLSDQKLLNHLAQETRGLFKLAKTDRDIHVIFTSIFEQVKFPDIVPLEGDSFYIDKEIQEATVLITKQTGTSTKLVDPLRTEIFYANTPKNIGWYQTRVFDLITIKKPTPGRWKVSLSAKEGNRVFVITDLILKSSINQNQVYQGEKIAIETWLEKKDKRVTDQKFLEPIFFMADIKEPNGNHTKFCLYSDKNEGNIEKQGIYSNTFTFKQPGDYTIQIMADGKTFKREQVRQVKALIRPAPKNSSSSTNSALKKMSQQDIEGIWIKAVKKFLLINLIAFSVLLMLFLGIKWKRKTKGKKEEEDNF